MKKTVEDRVEVTLQSLDGYITEYLRKLAEIPRTLSGLLETIHNPYELVEAVKRDHFRVEPYPDVSFFELSNRIGADLVALFGVRSLLHDGCLPFEKYDIALGTQQGMDIRAQASAVTLHGEAFNVAKSFFPTKKGRALRNLAQSDATYKVMMFNSDAVRDPDSYSRQQRDGVLYWVVNVREAFDQWVVK